MQKMIKAILRALGAINVKVADDGAEALKEMRTFPADIIICDWKMEPLDGIEFARMIRTGSDSPNPYIPIIMLTGFTEAGRVTEARDIGINEFLAKPVSPKSLYARIQGIIEKPRAFVRTASYFGPDRRRRQLKYTGPDRRQAEDSGQS
ncbi:MAG TPA: response regulator [Alphaproteobacteria bacterium]|nr:response regulator [Alphaproteobacteria bacterium]